MDYQFSDRTANLKCRTEAYDNKNIISFSFASPSREVLPIREIERISTDIFSRFPDDILPKGDPEGYEPLRLFLRGLLFQKNIFGNHDNVITTAGFCEALDLVCKALTDNGDTVICEEPVSAAVINIFKTNGLRVVGVPLNSDGIDTDRLQSALIKNPNAKFIFTIPNFQNPSGISQSFGKREELYSIAHKYDTIIVEDDSYGDLRFGGADEPSVKSFDKDGRVIYLNSFSNILAPSLRVGYICADSIITSKLTTIKNACGLRSTIWPQMVVKSFFDEFDYFDYTLGLSGYYRSKCKLMLCNLKFELPTAISFTEPEGGFFILGTLPAGADVDRFCKLMLDKQVSIASGTDFIISDKVATNSFRLNFSSPTDEEIINGIKILGDAVKCIVF